MLSLGVAFLTLALHGQGARERCLFGGLTGAVFYGLTPQWLTDLSVPGYIAMVMLETTLLAASVALIPAPRSGRWAGGWWALPAALVLLEVVQLRFPLGGFPLPGLALSQADGPFALAAPLGGSLLVTALAAVGGAVGIILAPSSSVPHSSRETSQLSTSQSSKAVAPAESSPTPLESPHVTLV